MIFVVLWFSLSSIINSIFHSILKYFCLPSLSSHVGTWKSSLLGATSTGTWPMRASSTCGTSSTCPRRSSPPPSAARPAQRPPDLVPRVRWSLFPHLKSFSNWNWLFCTFMMFQTHKLVCFPCNFCRISTSFPFNDIVNIVRTKKVDHRTQSLKIITTWKLCYVLNIVHWLISLLFGVWPINGCIWKQSQSISKTLLNQTWCFSGLEGERPARLARGEGDRDAYRRSAAPRTYTIHTVDISVIFICGLDVQHCVKLKLFVLQPLLIRRVKLVQVQPQNSSL